MSLEKLKEKVLTVTKAAKEKDCNRAAIYRALGSGKLTRFQLAEGRTLVLRDKRYEEWEPNLVGFRMKTLAEVRAEKSDSTENGSTEDGPTEDDSAEDG
jgi:hypothetical protein